MPVTNNHALTIILRRIFGLFITGLFQNIQERMKPLALVFVFVLAHEQAISVFLPISHEVYKKISLELRTEKRQFTWLWTYLWFVLFETNLWQILQNPALVPCPGGLPPFPPPLLPPLPFTLPSWEPVSSLSWLPPLGGVGGRGILLEVLQIRSI